MWMIFVNGPSDCTPAYDAAKFCGLKVVTIWIDRQQHDHGDRHLVSSTDDPKSIVLRLKEALGDETIVSALAFGDATVPLAGAINSLLGIKLPYDLEAAVKSKNKLAMRELLMADELNPEFRTIEFHSELQNTLGEFKDLDFTRPWIVKPIFGHASIGVVKVNSYADLCSSMPGIFNANIEMLSKVHGLNSKQTEHFKSTFLLESFVGGAEFSVEVLAIDGQVLPLEVCGKTEMLEPYFEEVTYMAPAQIDADLRNRLFSAATQVVKKLNVQTCCAHLEFKWDGSRLYFLDVGLRVGGGGLTHKLLNASSGRNLFAAWFASLAERPQPEMLRVNKESVALLYLAQVRSGGRVYEIGKLPLPESLKRYLIEKRSFIKAGDVLTGYPNYSGLPGYALFEIPASDIEDNAKLISETLVLAAEHFDPIYEGNNNA